MAASPILAVLVVPILLVILTTGTVLSSVSIWVYFRVCRDKHWKSPTHLLLFIHSTSQFFCSSSMLAFQVLKLDCIQILLDISTIFSKIFLFYLEKGHLILTFTHNFAKYMTYSTTEFIAILLWISVRNPFGAKTSCSVERVRLILIPLVLFSLLQASGHSLLEIGENETDGKFIFLNPIFPLLLICITHAILVWSLRKARNQRKYLIVHQKSRKVKSKTSTMIIFLITSNIITNLGRCIAGPTLWEYFDNESQVAKDIYWFLGIFMTTEPIFAFLSHFLFSSDYQKNVKGLFKFI